MYLREVGGGGGGLSKLGGSGLWTGETGDK